MADTQPALVVHNRSSSKPAIDDEGSRWYVSDHIRRLWITSGTAIGIAAGFLYGTAGVSAIAAAFGIPVALGNVYRTLMYRRRKLPARLPFPRAGEAGDPEITELLQRIYDQIHEGPTNADGGPGIIDGERVNGTVSARDVPPSGIVVPAAARLRLTLFLIDPEEDRTLRQYARYSTHSTKVGEVKVRMGTCDVGLAFTTCHTMHIPGIAKLGPTFVDAMRKLGLEDDEAYAYKDIDLKRSSFYSIPIIDANTRKRYGVLALDAIPPRFFIEHRTNLRHDALVGLLNQLLQAIIATKSDAMAVPANAAIRTQIAHRSEHSVLSVLAALPRSRPARGTDSDDGSIDLDD